MDVKGVEIGQLIDEIVNKVSRDRPGIALRMGNVVGTPGGGVVDVEVGGADDVPLKKLDSYTPTIGDTVWILEDPPNYLVLGKIG